MTYKQLLKRLQKATPEQLEQDVTLYVQHTDEYIPVTTVETADESQDVLDAGHLYVRGDY